MPDGADARPAGAPVRADGRRSHGHLLDAARETFTEEGADASLREVARRAGVGIATLYRHFPNREALLEALLAQAFDRLRDRAADLLTAPDPGRALIDWMAELTATSDRYDGLPARVLHALHDPGSTLHASCQGLRTGAGDLLTRAQRSGDIRADLTADELMGTAYAMAWVARQTGGGPEVEVRLRTLLVEGLAARPHSE
jgi:AcrR family transcriptional regulator